jgi:hypothetical protein
VDQRFGTVDAVGAILLGDRADPFALISSPPVDYTGLHGGGTLTIVVVRLTETGIHRYDSPGWYVFYIECIRAVILIHRHSSKGERV